jgi:hypothetical protein
MNPIKLDEVRFWQEQAKKHVKSLDNEKLKEEFISIKKLIQLSKLMIDRGSLPVDHVKELEILALEMASELQKRCK